MKNILIALLICLAGSLQAAVFTSKDSQFTIDLPSGWAQARTPAAGAVLSVVKGSARIDIKPVPECNSETCIEQKTQADLVSVKNKKMQVVGNTFTGEEIKRIDFSSGEPFFYINFFTSKNDFSSGYFLIGKTAYSILAKDLSYAQTDLIFSLISPVQSIPALEMDLSDRRAYDIEALPDVSSQPIMAVQPVQKKLLPPQIPAVAAAAPQAAPGRRLHTLVTRNMPPYIKQLGHGFDALVALLFLYVLLQAGAVVVRCFIKPQEPQTQVNPHSPYPIKFRRLYGTPSLIFRARDNQGNVLLSLSARWDGLFLFGGLILIIGAVLVMAFTGVLETTRAVRLSAFTYNTVYSAVSLVIPLGFVIFICGILWSQLVLRQFALYDSKGQKAVYVMQRGFGLKKECYLAYFVKSKEVLLLERKRFSWLRKWQLLDKERHVLAHIYEDSPARAVVRKFTGHLWGLLRASYVIEGPMDSQGKIENSRAAFNRFVCNMDKPQALSARDLLVTALIVNIRDRDKWYPWF